MPGICKTKKLCFYFRDLLTPIFSHEQIIIRDYCFSETLRAVYGQSNEDVIFCCWNCVSGHKINVELRESKGTNLCCKYFIWP